MTIKSLEDIKHVYSLYGKIENMAKATATYLGLFGSGWAHDSFEINENSVTVTAYDSWDDSYCGPAKKSITFPIKCLVDENFLKEYKIQREESMNKKQIELEKKAEEALEQEERAQLACLKEKYEDHER